MALDINEELIERTLQQLNIPREQFEREVEELRKNSSVEVMGNLLSLIMESMDATANMLSLVMLQNAELQKQIDEVKGGNANA